MYDVFRGSVNTWQCDEMGHLNVRHYVAISREAVTVLASRLGATAQRLRAEGLAIRLVDQHIHFKGEARAGNHLHGLGGVLATEGEAIRVLIELRHAPGAGLSATFNTVLMLEDLATADPIPWPEDVLDKASAELMLAPDYALPRSISLDPPGADVNLTEARRLDLREISLGAVDLDQCDTHLRMRPEFFIGRISDGAGALFFQAGGPPETPDADGRRIGGAVLEYRLHYIRRPRFGDVIAVHSATKEVTEKTFRVGHWILDGATGEALAIAEAIAVFFDLETRKAVPIAGRDRNYLEANLVPQSGF